MSRLQNIKPVKQIFFTKEFISEAAPPHPCPLPPGERGLINITPCSLCRRVLHYFPSLEGRG